MYYSGIDSRTTRHMLLCSRIGRNTLEFSELLETVNFNLYRLQNAKNVIILLVKPVEIQQECGITRVSSKI